MPGGPSATGEVSTSAAGAPAAVEQQGGEEAAAPGPPHAERTWLLASPAPPRSPLQLPHALAVRPGSRPSWACLDPLLRPWHFLQSRRSAVEWLTAVTFLLGGVFFVIGSFSSSLPAVHAQATATEQGQLYNWLVRFTFLAGSYLFTAGSYCLILASLNHPRVPGGGIGLSRQAHFQEDDKPYAWVGCRLASLEWWAAFVVTVGCLLYNIGTTTSFLGGFFGVRLTVQQTVALIRWPFFGGGALFLVGGWLYVALREGWARTHIGLVPTNGSDLRDLDFWVNCLNFWGGVGFFGSGCLIIAPVLFPSFKPNPVLDLIQNWLGFGLGSLCFTLGGWLLLLKLSWGRQVMLLPDGLAVGDGPVDGAAVECTKEEGGLELSEPKE